MLPSDKPIHLVVDSTGLVYGSVRTKRRTWRKLLCGVHEATGEVVAQTRPIGSMMPAGRPAVDPSRRGGGGGRRGWCV